MELNCSDSGVKGMVALWAWQTFVPRGHTPLPAHPDTTGCLPDSSVCCYKLGRCTLHKVTWWNWKSGWDFTGKNGAKILNILRLSWNATSFMKLSLIPHPPAPASPFPGQNEALSYHYLHCIYFSPFSRLNPQILYNFYCHQIGGGIN